MPATPRSSDHLALGRAVRELRARHGVSQEELGFRCTLHRNYVGAVERGELNPTYGVLLRLCGGLAVTLSELVELAERRAGGGAVTACAEAHVRRRHGRRWTHPHRHRCALERVRLLPLWDGQLTPGAAHDGSH